MYLARVLGTGMGFCIVQFSSFASGSSRSSKRKHLPKARGQARPIISPTTSSFAARQVALK